MISSDAAANVLAVSVGEDSIPRFWVSLFGSAMPTTAAQLSGAWNSPGPLLTYKNLVATDEADYAITWSTPTSNSRLLVRDPAVNAAGTGLSAAGANGTVATWMMIHEPDDQLLSDTSKKRYAFSVGTSGTEVIMANPLVTQSATKNLDYTFTLTFYDP